jgi:hypothetical protein
MDTVASTAFVPSTLATTIWLILRTVFDDAAFWRSTTAVVPDGVKYVVLPVIVVRDAIFGAAIV